MSTSTADQLAKTSGSRTFNKLNRQERKHQVVLALRYEMAAKKHWKGADGGDLDVAAALSFKNPKSALSKIWLMTSCLKMVGTASFAEHCYGQPERSALEDDELWVTALELEQVVMECSPFNNMNDKFEYEFEFVDQWLIPKLELTAKMYNKADNATRKHVAAIVLRGCCSLAKIHLRLLNG